MRALTVALSLALTGLSFAGQAHAADPCADYVPQPKPQNAGRDEVGQDLDQIVERGFMLFAVYENYPPYSWEEAGQPRGVDVDIARLIAEEIGVKAQFNFVSSDENLEADLRNNVWKGAVIGGRVSNVMMRVPYDSAFKCRVEQVVFTGQYSTESIAIAYVMQAAMTALNGGETKAAMGPLGQLEYGLTEATDVHQPPLAGFAVSKWTLGVGVNFRFRPLSYAVDDAIYAALEDGRIAAIFDSYGLSFQPPLR